MHAVGGMGSESKRILGGYRFICGRDIRFDRPGVPRLATGHLFSFSEDFVENYLPYTIELGRSFVRIEARPQAMPQAAKPFTSSTISGTGSVLFLSSIPRSDIFSAK